RVAELVPPVRGPDQVLAATTGSLATHWFRLVDAPRLELRPVQRVTRLAVREAVDPPLRQVVPRVRLHLDGDILVVALLALGGLVVVEPAGIGAGGGEVLRARLGTPEGRVGEA